MCTITVLLLWALASSPHTASNRSREATGWPLSRMRQARMANSFGVRQSGSPCSVAAWALSSSAMPPHSSTSWSAAFPASAAALRRRRARTRATSSRGLNGFTT